MNCPGTECYFDVYEQHRKSSELKVEAEAGLIEARSDTGGAGRGTLRLLRLLRRRYLRVSPINLWGCLAAADSLYGLHQLLKETEWS